MSAAATVSRWKNGIIAVLVVGVLLLLAREKVSEIKVYDDLRKVLTFQLEPCKDKISVQEMVTTLEQDDPRILEYIREKHLFPPSTEEYNLTQPDVDGGKWLADIIRRELKNKKNGFFIEAGSNDGEFWSSTLGLERFDGWTGLCVEPSTGLYDKWRSKKRKVWFSNVCLSTQRIPMWTEFLHRSDYSIASKVGQAEDVGAWNQTGTWMVEKVPCFPIYSLLRAMNVKEVDYFNLDVEGLEMEVLRTIPFKEVTIRTIGLELHPPHIPPTQEAKETVLAFMDSHGYKIVHDKHPDYVFVLNTLN